MAFFEGCLVGWGGVITGAGVLAGQGLGGGVQGLRFRGG